MAAYGWNYGDKYSQGGGVAAYNFCTARSRGVTTVPVNAETGRGDAVADVVVASGGQIAWMETGDLEGLAKRVLVSTRTARRRLLDESSDIEIGSLAVAGLTVYWTRAGQPESAGIG